METVDTPKEVLDRELTRAADIRRRTGATVEEWNSGVKHLQRVLQKARERRYAYCWRLLFCSVSASWFNWSASSLKASFLRRLMRCA
jgi:hypothetical protein